jgi:hypothetical protein
MQKNITVPGKAWNFLSTYVRHEVLKAVILLLLFMMMMMSWVWLL